MSHGQCAVGCRVDLAPLGFQDGVGGCPGAVDQDALLAAARLPRLRADGPGLRFGDGAHSQGVGQVHTPPQSSLTLCLSVHLAHAIEVNNITEAQRGQVQPRMLLLVRILDGYANIHVVRSPGTTVVFPFPNYAFPRS